MTIPTLTDDQRARLQLALQCRERRGATIHDNACTCPPCTTEREVFAALCEEQDAPAR